MSDRFAHQERHVAQPEAIKFLNSVGMFFKNRDGVGTVCKRCGNYVVAIEHTEAGVADYLGGVRTDNGPVYAAVEVKASGTVMPLSRIEDDQWAWMKNFENRTGGTAWVWMMLGDAPINATNSPFCRVTYLVPQKKLYGLMTTIQEMTDGKQSTLPMNNMVTRIRFGAEYEKRNIYADTALADCAMTWEGAGLWIPIENHLWYDHYKSSEI